MNGQASLSLRGRNPDVLTCIANLSNDEVFHTTGVRQPDAGCCCRSLGDR